MTLRCLTSLSPIGLIAFITLQACSSAPLDDEFGGYEGYNPNASSSSSGTTDTFTGTIPTTIANFEECAMAKGEVRKLPVYMQIVLDGSGSMDVNDPQKEGDPRDGNKQHGRKWLAAREALVSFFDGPQDPHMAIGMYVFESNQKKPSNQIDVAIAAVDAAQATRLKARILPPVFGDGSTPLGTSIKNQTPFLKSYVAPPEVGANGKRVMVVITDGIPQGDSFDKNGVLNIVRTESADGTKFFAVGVGNPTGPESDYSEGFIGDIAIAGNTKADNCTPGWNQSSPATDKPCHFQITPGARTADQIRIDFLAAINQIRDSVGSCEYALEKPAGSGEIDPAKVNVTLTSGANKEITVLQDSVDGWSYDNPTTPKSVKLNGAACTAAKNDTQTKVKIVVGCVTQMAAPR